MTASSLPTFDDLLQPLLQALHAAGGRATNDELRRAVEAALELPAEVTAQLHKQGSAQTELEYRLQWARTYLRQVGLIDRPRRGVWVLTPAGWETRTVDPGEVVRAVQSRHAARRNSESGQAPIFPEPRAEPAAAAGSRSALRSPTPRLPTYGNVRHFLVILNGVARSAYRAMDAAIYEQRGSPQEQVDWSNPDEWIDQRLAGANRDLARRIWRESGRTLNPRHTRSCWDFAAKHDLLARDRADVLRITDRGQTFLAEPDGALVAEIDNAEGVLLVLQLVAAQSTARRSHLLPGYGEYSRANTTLQSDTVLKFSLYNRLRNLVERGLVAARGNSYAITEAGLQYLEHYAEATPQPSQPASRSAELFRLARSLSEEARAQLHAHLLNMNPFQFEALIKLLLEEIGYDNVQVTSPTNDRGVDVVGTIKLGISEVREVVQVKRQHGAVGRPVLDMLRGSLHRFNAVRGTIITTGRFSRGVEAAAFERGAAPITLIDGDKLLDLLVENEIGVSKRPVEYLEFAPEKLRQFEGQFEGEDRQ